MSLIKAIYWRQAVLVVRSENSIQSYPIYMQANLSLVCLHKYINYCAKSLTWPWTWGACRHPFKDVATVQGMMDAVKIGWPVIAEHIQSIIKTTNFEEFVTLQPCLWLSASELQNYGVAFLSKSSQSIIVGLGFEINTIRQKHSNLHHVDHFLNA